MTLKWQTRRNDLRRIARSKQVKIVQAIDNSCSVFVIIARSLAPVDTGFLRSSIEQTKFARYGSLIGTVEAKALYAMFVEYGTVNMAAQPFMTPAAEQARRLFNKEMRLVFK